MAGSYIKSGPYGTNIGSLNEYEYARRLPGGPEGVTARCKKPQYSRSQKRKMARRPQVVRFNELMREAHLIFADPKQKAEWEVRHQEALREGKRHNKYVPFRLWDYVRHELNEEMKMAEKGE